MKDTSLVILQAFDTEHSQQEIEFQDTESFRQWYAVMAVFDVIHIPARISRFDEVSGIN